MRVLGTVWPPPQTSGVIPKIKMNKTKNFCDLVRKRTQENKNGMSALHQGTETISPMMSVLRQELDSMVRVIYLLSIKDLKLRENLISSTLAGKKWQIPNNKGKTKNITDKEMVELSQKLHGWTKSVYKFGCSFIHLSNFHNHDSQNPFKSLPKEEQKNIIEHMRHYHGGPHSDCPTMKELSLYFPQVLEKISSNLECYLKQLEENKILEIENV
jgi:hypothetical protein